MVFKVKRVTISCNVLKQDTSPPNLFWQASRSVVNNIYFASMQL